MVAYGMIAGISASLSHATLSRIGFVWWLAQLLGSTVAVQMPRSRAALGSHYCHRSLVSAMQHGVLVHADSFERPWRGLPGPLRSHCCSRFRSQYQCPAGRSLSRPTERRVAPKVSAHMGWLATRTLPPRPARTVRRARVTSTRGNRPWNVAWAYVMSGYQRRVLL